MVDWPSLWHFVLGAGLSSFYDLVQAWWEISTLVFDLGSGIVPLFCGAGMGLVGESGMSFCSTSRGPAV